MRRKININEFISKARLIHGDKYDYSKVNYVNNSTKVCIICPEHGEFWQSPSAHIYQKQGCPKCGLIKSKERKKTTEQFIAEARAVHGDKYDYSKVVYKSNNDKVCIIYKGREFWQTPKNHLSHKCEKGKTCNGESNSKCYKVWSHIIDRCSDFNKINKKRPHYLDVTICKEWLTYDNFKKWFENPENGYREGYQIDKDILVNNNKIYSPETCCFVPQEINLIVRKEYKNNKYTGVIKNGSCYLSVISFRGTRYIIGKYKNKQDAFIAYKNAKTNLVHNIAKEYFDRNEITSKVYNALMRYNF